MTKQPSPKLTSNLTSDPSSGTNTRTHRWQAKSLAGIAALGLLLGGATACSDDGSKDKDSGVASSSEKATNSAAVNKDSNLNEAILPPEDGPQGAEYFNVGATFNERQGAHPEDAQMFSQMASDTTFNPPECTGLYLSGADLIAMVARDPQKVAAVQYSVGGAGDNAAEPANPEDPAAQAEGDAAGEQPGTDTGADGATYSVVLSGSDSSPKVPQDIGACKTFTREYTQMSGARVMNFSTTPWDAGINGADELVAAEEKLDNVTVGGQDSDMPGIGETNYLIAGTVNGVYFQVVSLGKTASKDAVKELAQKQVDRLRG